ncbi:MAG: hypothetical protein ACOYOQ_00530 [Microthrixaceae bacterium]
MMEQLNLLDGPALRDEALARVNRNADTDWKAVARTVVAALAAAGEPFTTDEVWGALDAQGVETHERRALGAIITAAARDGKIERVGFRVSTRPECHARPITVWVGR